MCRLLSVPLARMDTPRGKDFHSACPLGQPEPRGQCLTHRRCSFNNCAVFYLSPSNTKQAEVRKAVPGTWIRDADVSLPWRSLGAEQRPTPTDPEPTPLCPAGNHQKRPREVQPRNVQLARPLAWKHPREQPGHPDKGGVPQAAHESSQPATPSAGETHSARRTRESALPRLPRRPAAARV